MLDSAALSLLEGKIPALPMMVAERSLSRDIDELVAQVLPPMKLAVVDDANTRSALGDLVFRALKGRFACTHVTLHAPHADGESAHYLRTQTLSCDALVAVGGGTVSDLCKYVSHQAGKPYVMFPTAASMNGYLSANASISIEGYKKTCPAHLPKAVLCDLSVIAAAPLRLSQSGLGDSLARPTAQADWLLSHLLLGTPYDETPFKLLAGVEPELFDSARGVALADPASIALLMKTLLLSGLGMTVAGGSHPASQGEHMIAHAYEMMNARSAGRASPEHGPMRAPAGAQRGHITFHGEAIAVTTLFMARMQEKLLRGAPRLRPDDFPEEKIAALYGAVVASEAKKAFADKFPSPHRGEKGRGASGEGSLDSCPPPNLPPMGGGIIDDWPAIAAKIETIHLPPARLQAILEAAKVPVAPEALGWSAEDFHAAAETARYLRERFTFLDLLIPA